MSVERDNPYLSEAVQALPRVLAGFDLDPTGPSHGMGDRLHWAWGLTDFPNGTFQGAVHGMARLWAHRVWPWPANEEIFLSRVDAIIGALDRCRARDGSLAEAFPGEGSWCVTALGAYDCLSAVELLSQCAGEGRRSDWLDQVEPLIAHLMRHDERHAFISNHLATGAAALTLWSDLTGSDSADERAEEIVGRILSSQHSEGWFREYQGADPGYQSLATYYLADVARRRPHLHLAEALERSTEFLAHFVHRDGSFGGVYGSRNTRFFVPAGFHLLAPTSKRAAAMARRMARSVEERTVVTLATIDPQNLPPMFNAYCWAAVTPVDAVGDVLPCDGPPSRSHFPGAGLLVDVGSRHHTVVSTHKGGVVHHVREGALPIVDGGVAVRNRRGRLATTQTHVQDSHSTLEGDLLTVTPRLRAAPKRLPSAAQFAFLRVLALTLFRSRRLREWTKRRMVRMLVTGGRPWRDSVVRTVHLGEHLQVADDVQLSGGHSRLSTPGAFTSIHMASQGYWQVQDEGG